MRSSTLQGYNGLQTLAARLAGRMAKRLVILVAGDASNAFRGLGMLQDELAKLRS